MNVDTRSKDYTDKISLNTFNLRKYNLQYEIPVRFVYHRILFSFDKKLCQEEQFFVDIVKV